MKKVKVEALRKYRVATVKNTSIVKIGEMEIEVKLHTTILEKADFAVNVYNSSLKDIDGVHVVDGVLYDMAYKIRLIKRYTNLTLPTDGIEAYSLMVDTGIYEQILDVIPNVEKEELNRIVKRYIEDKQNEYDQAHSTGFIFKKLADAVKKVIPSLDDMEGMLSNVNGFIKGLEADDSDKRNA